MTIYGNFLFEEQKETTQFLFISQTLRRDSDAPFPIIQGFKKCNNITHPSLHPPHHHQSEEGGNEYLQGLRLCLPRPPPRLLESSYPVFISVLLLELFFLKFFFHCFSRQRFLGSRAWRKGESTLDGILLLLWLSVSVEGRFTTFSPPHLPTCQNFFGMAVGAAQKAWG